MRAGGPRLRPGARCLYLLPVPGAHSPMMDSRDGAGGFQLCICQILRWQGPEVARYHMRATLITFFTILCIFSQILRAQKGR